MFLDKKPTHKAIHIAKSHEANSTSQNLAISMSLPTLKEKLTKLKETERMKKAQGTTLYISNGGQGAINETNMNKINNGEIMKVSATKSATAHILVRCAT